MALADDIAALESAIRRGVQSVSYDGQRVEYQSREAMVATLTDMKKQAGLIGTVTRSVYPTDRGFR